MDIIAIDVDNTITITMPHIKDFHNEYYGTSHTLEDYTTYNLGSVWQCSKSEVERRIAHFNLTPYIHKISVIPQAPQTLKKLAKNYKLIAVSSRPIELLELTNTFLKENFPQLFSEVHLTNRYGREGRKRKKSEICTEAKPILIVDDCLEELLECAQEGFNGLLFDFNGEYAWNKTNDSELPPNITRVKSWEEAEDYIAQHYNPPFTNPPHPSLI